MSWWSAPRRVGPRSLTLSEIPEPGHPGFPGAQALKIGAREGKSLDLLYMSIL